MVENNTPTSIISPTALNIVCEFSSTVKSLSSPTHTINVKELGNNRSIVTLAEGQVLDTKFSVNFLFDSLADNVAWVSNNASMFFIHLSCIISFMINT